MCTLCVCEFVFLTCMCARVFVSMYRDVSLFSTLRRCEVPELGFASEQCLDIYIYIYIYIMCI